LNETKPPLALAPPLTGNQLVEAERAEQLAGAWRALATLFPTETARWLATQCDPSISIDSARVVQMVPSGKSPVHAADAEPEQPDREDPQREGLANVLLGAMRKQAPAGMTIERVRLDRGTMQREREVRISRVPFPVVLDASGHAGGRRRSHMLIGLALPPASEDGSGIARELLGAVEWYMHACENLAEKDGLSTDHATQQVYFFTVPVYVWHASGLLDPEEDGGPTGTADPITLLFGDAFARQETDARRRERREQNRAIIDRRLERDARRREAAASREHLFGDRMISEEQLRSLHVEISEEAPRSHGLHLSWNGVRLWERDANKLLAELPLELLALTMLAAPGPTERAEILEKALWRLRKLDGRAAFERCLIPLAAMARVWLPDDQSSPILMLAHKRFLGRK